MYVEVCFNSIPRLCEISVNKFDVKLVALSVTIVSGMPYLEIHVISAFAQASADVEVKGIVSGQRVALSIIVNKCVYPHDEGSGPTTSM